MAYRLRPWQLASLIVILCVSLIGGLFLYQARARSLPELMRYLPEEDGFTLYADLHALRESGLLDRLAGSRAPQEPEYTAFVNATGFDFRQDLDSALIRFNKSATYVIVTGRFQWSALRDYALQSRGECVNAFCRMAGSEPDRKISFCPLNSHILALGIGPLPGIAYDLQIRRPRSNRVLSDRAVWISFQPAALQSGSRFPAGTQLFAKALAGADSVTVSFGPADKRLAGFLEARCHSAQAAENLLNQMVGLTELVRSYILRSGQKPNAADLSGVLTGGSFSRQGNVVYGQWPIEWAFIDALGA